jgi:hypothetical protein
VTSIGVDVGPVGPVGSGVGVLHGLVLWSLGTGRAVVLRLVAERVAVVVLLDVEVHQQFATGRAARGFTSNASSASAGEKSAAAYELLSP